MLHSALVRVDSGTRGPQDPEFPPPENGYYPEYTPYDPRAPPPPPPPPPAPPLPMPPHYTYSEPGFQQQPPHIDPYYGSESDGQCSIM
ncbi:hypothetical protein TIFTF001_020891 [Ficus carica]|uniref:Uncharacterized protein n=1 Tax=Ficus carica TaxID=3494 RepID=A0AA88AJF9_FICCA|nr:hypothetical protein TIFTF001_020891 [Ficus carica]